MENDVVKEIVKKLKWHEKIIVKLFAKKIEETFIIPKTDAEIYFQNKEIINKEDIINYYKDKIIF